MNCAAPGLLSCVLLQGPGCCRGPGVFVQTVAVLVEEFRKCIGGELLQARA